jgi:O-antigen/teichoic acid export membrane protein
LDPINSGAVRAEDVAFWQSSRWWRRTGRTSLALWGSTALAFAAGVVAARTLGPDRYGAVVLAESTVFLLGTLLDLSLEEATVYQGSKAVAAGRTARLRGLVKTALVLDIGIGFAVFAGVFTLASPIADLVSGGNLDPVLIQLAALGALAGTGNGVTGGILLLSRRPDLRAWMLAITGAARLGLVLIAVPFGTPRAVITAFAVAAGIGGLFQALIAWQVGWRRWKRGSGANAERVTARSLLGFAFHSSMTTTLIAGREAIVSLILGRVAGTRAVGTFAVAMLPVSLAAAGSAPLRLAIFPEHARLFSEGRISLLRRSVLLYTVVGLLVGVIGSFLGWSLLPWLILELYSAEFETAVAPARVLLIAMVCLLATGWSKSLPASVGRPAIRTGVSLLELVMTVLLTALLARQGPLGAAMAVSVTAFASSVTWIGLIPRITKDLSASR